MIDELKIIDILRNPSLSLPEIKEKLARLNEEFEDIEMFIINNIGDSRFAKRSIKHRGIIKRKLNH